MKMQVEFSEASEKFTGCTSYETRSFVIDDDEIIIFDKDDDNDSNRPFRIPLDDVTSVKVIREQTN